MEIFIAIVLSCFLAAVATQLLLDRRFSKYFVDVPSDRSLHASPVSRAGGIAVVSGCLSGWALLVYSGMVQLGDYYLLLCFLPVFVASVIEDAAGMPIPMRLLVQFLSAAAFVILSGHDAITIVGNAILESWGASIFVMMTLVYLINIYNFMDGMDGFASSMAIAGFGSIGLIFLLAGDMGMAAAAFCVGAAASGFIGWNLPKARIFLGDSGSTSLGCMAAIFIVSASIRHGVPVGLGAICFAPFIMDGTITLFRRIMRRAPFWQPHRGHLYQRMVLVSGSHFSVLWRWQLGMLGCGISAIMIYGASLGSEWQAVATVVFWVVGATLFIVFDHRFS